MESRSAMLLAGNRSDSEKANYDFEALAKHIANGLETLGVLMFIALVFSYFPRTDGLRRPS